MADNLQIKIGLNSSAVKTGLATVRDQFRDLGKFAGSGLVGAFGVAGISAGVAALIEKGSQINDLAERFGLTAEGMQRIGNAAAQSGSSIEAAAQAMNKLALSQEKVREGNDEAAKSLATLGIDAAAFINLTPEQAFYRIADATSTASDRQAAYAAVIQLMGKSSGELFTTLEQGSESIRRLGDSVGVMTDETVARLDELGDSLDAARGRFSVLGAEAVIFFDKLISKGKLSLQGLKAMFTGDDAALAALSFKFQEIDNPTPKQRPKKALREVEEGKAGPGANAADQADDRIARLLGRLATLERDAALDQLDTQGKINALIEERFELAKQLASEGDLERQLAIKVREVELDREIFALRQRADKEGGEAKAVRSSRQTVIADNLTKIGLGGNAVLSRDRDPAEKAARTLEKIDQKEGRQTNLLERIADKRAEWNP